MKTENRAMERMLLTDALSALKQRRTDQIVVPTMAAAREWMRLGTHADDFIYAPSTMGGAPLVGLGLALARPERQVIVLNGDGSLLMNLGCLVTITAAAPENLVLITIANGVYEVTGAQPTPGAPAGRANGRDIDFAAVARSCGFTEVHAFTRLDEWTQQLPTVLAAKGPTFVTLSVQPVPDGSVPRSPAPPADRAKQFAAHWSAAK